MTSISEPAVCRICGSKETRGFSAREMMFGLREEFAYFECRECGCVQIATYPADIARLYPDDYYAYTTRPAKPLPTQSWLKQQARAAFMRMPTLRAWWLSRPSTRQWLVQHPEAALYPAIFPNAEARLLDVGCGDGKLPQQLRDLGYRHACGVDPFVAADVVQAGRLLVRKAQLREMSGKFDGISFHHALEHIPDQVAILGDAARLLAKGGSILLRIPVVGGLAWRTYGAGWVQLDPPRHYYLHSLDSLHRLAASSGLKVTSVRYDSTGFQFWGSELYRRDIPLHTPRVRELFTSEQMAEYERRAEALNAAADGDQIIALLAAA